MKTSFFQILRQSLSNGSALNITSLNDLLAQPMRQRVADPYAQCSELNHRDLYAVDGHYHHAASFDPKTQDAKGNARAIATGHIFRLNLRNHHLSSLDMVNPEDGKKKAHDITVIKRRSAEELRYRAANGPQSPRNGFAGN